MRSDEVSADSRTDDPTESPPLTRSTDGAFGDRLAEGRTEAGDVVLAVIDAVAGLEGVTFADLPPLHDAVEPEALANIFSRHDGGFVVFRYLDYVVRVDASGRYAVYAAPSDELSN